MTTSSAETIRAFIAVRPNDAAQAELVRIQRELKHRLASSGLRIKWTDPETFHITLLFLGDIPADGVYTVFQALKEVDALTQSVETFLSGLGLFKKTGAFWVGIDVPVALMKLQKELAAALNMNPGRFHAHFTLGRVKAGRGQEDFFQTLETCTAEGGKTEVEPVPFNIDSIELVQSELLQKGPRHTVLWSIP